MVKADAVASKFKKALQDGTLTKYDMERRVEAVIEAELGKDEADMALVDACEKLLWEINTHGEQPFVSPRERILAGLREQEEAKEKPFSVGKSRVRLAVVMALAAMLLFLIVSPFSSRWFQSDSTPDEQQFIVQGNEITVEMVQAALAEHSETADDIVYSYKELRNIVPFLPVKSPFEEKWAFEWGEARFYRNRIEIVQNYSYNYLHSQRSLTFQMICCGSLEEAFITFEQSYSGNKTLIDNRDVYVTQNEEKISMVWMKDNNILSIGCNDKYDETIRLVRILLE